MERYYGFTSKLLAVLENDSQVNSFMHHGVRVWPLLRIVLYFRLHEHVREIGMQWFEGWLSERHPWAAFAEAVNHRFAAILADQPENPPCPEDRFFPADAAPTRNGRPVLVFAASPTFHTLNTPAGVIEPVIDPWIEILAEHRPVLKVEIASDAAQNLHRRKHPSLLIVPWTMETVRQRGRDAEVEHFIQTFMAALACTVAFVNERYGFDLYHFVSQDMRTIAYSTIIRKFMFDDLLTALQPEAILFQNYYDTDHMGLIWSAAERGIPTLEIQHGANGPFHPAYSLWTVVPDEGYHLLPTHFVVWGLSSARNIDAHFSRRQTRHRILVGGRPSAMTREPSPMPPEEGAVLNGIRKACRKVVLVTLPPGNLMNEGLSPSLVDAIRRAPSDWFWLIRSHPLVPEDSPTGWRGAETRLRSAGITNTECRAATRAPLEPVIALSDHHVSQLSSTGLNCLEDGVPTTYINPYSLSFYKDLIDARHAYFEATPDGIIASIEQGWKGLIRPNRLPVEPDGTLAHRVIGDVLNLGAHS
ncbi:hypothetical protein [Azospirillum tabaci]|uniref:hypothetical protein n=1 Tax=Azospirillum tabaci TaxID=2752310 RepID=UPI001660EC58|nr:hypothetical protein [Azospirillum tabaci]